MKIDTLFCACIIISGLFASNCGASESVLVLIPENSYHPRCVKAQSDSTIAKGSIFEFDPFCDRSKERALTRAGDKTFRE
jgi:hypothetical protein